MDDIPKTFAQFGENLVAEAKRIEEDATYSAKDTSKQPMVESRAFLDWHPYDRCCSNCRGNGAEEP